MKDKVFIAPFGLFALIILYVNASDKSRGYYIQYLKQDIFTVNIMGIIGSCLLFLMYWLIFYRTNKQPFTLSLKQLYGSILAKLILIAYGIYFIIIAAFDLRDVTHIVSSFLLDPAPVFILSLFMILVVLMALYKEIEVISRVSVPLLLLLILTFSMFTIFILTTNPLDITNLLPFFETKNTDIILFSAYTAYAIPFGELVVFLWYLHYLKHDEYKPMKYAFASLLFGCFVLALLTLYNIMILTPYTMQYTFAPALRVAKRIDIQQFLQRFDLIAIQVEIIISYVKEFILLFASYLCFSHVFKQVKKSYIIIPLCALTLYLSLYYQEDYLLLLEFRYLFFIPYVSIWFEVVFPFITLLFTYIRKPK